MFEVWTTRALIERVQSNLALRRLCGWEPYQSILSEATFSRVFAELAANDLLGCTHEALVKVHVEGHVVGHIARGSTAIPAQTERPTVRQRRKRRWAGGRGAAAKLQPSRLDRQPSMTLEEMLADLPEQCDKGPRENAQGYRVSWNGYKWHADVAEGGIVVSCVLTSASLHDSQVVIPVATMTAGRGVGLYDLMDSAYDAAGIKDHNLRLGHVPLIDVNSRRSQQLQAERKLEGRQANWLFVRE